MVSPVVADSRRLDLCDPAIPESRQPYHAGLGTARSSGPELSRLLASVKRFGRRSAAGLLREYQSAGYDIAGAGVIVGSLIDPAVIANDHIRIHALEGRLFRTVVEDAATQAGLSCTIWRERDLYAASRETLRQTEPAIRQTLAKLGRGVAGPWRVEQKMAALAAWIVLSAVGPRRA
jgi:hypothetical protein